MKLYVKLEAPFEWVRAIGQNVEAFGEVGALSEYPLDDADELIGVVPGEWVTAHVVSIPARSKKQFQAAVPFALEELVSEEIENLHFICPQWRAGEDAVVFVIAKSKMLEWQSLANDNKLPLDKLTAEHSLLPFHEGSDCSLALCVNANGLDNQFNASHRNGVGVSIDSEFIDVWLMGLPLDHVIAVNDEEATKELIASNPDRDFRHWPFGHKLAHWLEHEPVKSHDLYADEYRPSVRKFNFGSFMMPLVILATAIISVMAYDTYRYLALHAEIKSLNEKQEIIVKEIFPEVGSFNRDGARAAMQKAMSEFDGGGPREISAQLILAKSSKVLKSQRVTLSGVSYRDSELIITCLLNDFSQVDKITQQLNSQAGMSAILDSSASDDGRVFATYKLKAG